VTGISVPHYWLGMVLVIIFSVELGLLPAMGMGEGSSAEWVWDWAHMRSMVLPVITLSVIPLGIVTRTVRAAVAEILGQEYVQALRAKGLRECQVLVHVAKNAAPTMLAVLGLQFGYLLGGSILIETVFSWPGTGFLLNNAIFRRDIPVLQGTILVLSLFFVLLNMLVDLAQTAIDPRIRRS
jgi:peptide/nickel transport system permease protein